MKLRHQSTFVTLTLVIILAGATTCFAQAESGNDSNPSLVTDGNETSSVETSRSSHANQRIAEKAIKSKANLFADTSGTTASPDPAPQATDPDEWHFQFSPYLWIAGISGRAGIGNLQVEVNSSITDDNVKLNSGFMGVFEARKNRFVLLADIQYSNLGTDRPTPGPLFSSAEADFKTFIFDGEAGYRVVDNVTDKRSLDIVGGIRVWRLEMNLNFASGILAARSATATRSWVDAVGGVRGRAFLTERIFVAGKADLGGGGSKFTWQLFGVGGFQVHPKVALVGGYRWLSVNYDKDNFLFDNVIHGPVLGATFIIK
jgi:hypothetical protein